MLGALCAACDPGPHQDEPTAGTTPVHLVASNVSANQVLPANASIELAFDRLLLPSSVTRQTFILDNGAVTPTIAYDPVARIVTITPILPANSPPGTAPLAQGQFHELAIASPQSATDPNGLRAIDGTTLDKTSMNQIVFMAGAPVSNLPSVPQVDFCNDVFGPVFTTCVGVACHSQTPPPAEGLLLTTVPGIAQTAIGRVAHESNTGASALPYPPGLHFGVNMPIIDPGMGSGGNPANSWLLYKMLMAEPAVPWPACEGGPIAADAGGDANDAAAANEPDADGAGAVATNEGGADAGADAASHADASLDGAADGGGEDGGLEASQPASMPPAPTSLVNGVYSICPQPLSNGERATLANLIPGREMPFPPIAPGTSTVNTGVPVPYLELISFWIAQGAQIPAAGCGQ